MPDNNPPPNDDEPTRIGGQPPQRPPMPPQQPQQQPPQQQPPQQQPPQQQPPQQQPPQQQPPQSPFPQQPYRPAPQQPYPPQGYPQQGPPQAGQNPFGQPPGQYPPGQYPPGQYPPGPPGYGQQPPQSPPPYGPGGPGGPGGYGPPKRTGLKVGLILGAAVIVIGAVAAVAFITVKNTGDDGGTQATDPGVSETTSPSGSPSGSPSEPTTDAPTEVPTASGASTGAPASESFKAEYGFQTGQVCTGMAMTNASPYNPKKPQVAAYGNRPGNEEGFFSLYIGYSKPWNVPYESFKDVGVVACLSVDSATAKPAGTCTAKDENDKRFKYTLNTVDYTLTFVEATTGSQLGGEQKLSGSSTTCPSVVFLPEGEDYYVSPEPGAIESAIDDFVG